MKTLHTILILTLLTIRLNAQEIKTISTSELIPIANKFGIDSALNLSGGFPIYIIDTLTAINLLDFVSNYERYSRTEYFFNNMAHNWKTQFMREKTFNLSRNEFEKIKQGKPNKYGNLREIDDKLILSILKQKPDSIENLLINCYWYCSKFADSLKAKFPSGISRFFYSFKNGTHPIVEAYQDCNMNCYKIMWTLEQLKSEYFDSKKLKFHNSQLRHWQQNPDILRFEDSNQEYDIKIVSLRNQYNSISGIDFTNEPELKNIMSAFDTKDKCWKFMLINKKQGFLDLGCQFAPLSGHGIIYKLELFENNKLKITKITEWIS